jgi:hypothetical protein
VRRAGGLDQLRGRDGRICVFGDPREFVPVESAVEPHAEPAAVADVGRHEETLRVGLHQHPLDPVGSGAPDREAAVAVVVRQDHQKRPLATDEEGGCAVAEALARLGQTEADLADPPQRALAFGRVDHRSYRRMTGPAGNTEIVSEGLKQARKALGRGAADEALVLLWNALESARLAGDRRELGIIERLALHVASEGDESQQREAERLLEAVRGSAAENGALRPATAESPGEVLRGGEEFEPAPQEEGQSQPRRGLPVGTIIWLLVVLAVVILNVLGQARE